MADNEDEKGIAGTEEQTGAADQKDTNENQAAATGEGDGDQDVKQEEDGTEKTDDETQEIGAEEQEKDEGEKEETQEEEATEDAEAGTAGESTEDKEQDEETSEIQKDEADLEEGTDKVQTELEEDEVQQSQEERQEEVEEEDTVKEEEGEESSTREEEEQGKEILQEEQSDSFAKEEDADQRDESVEEKEDKVDVDLQEEQQFNTEEEEKDSKAGGEEGQEEEEEQEQASAKENEDNETDVKEADEDKQQEIAVEEQEEQGVGDQDQVIKEAEQQEEEKGETDEQQEEGGKQEGTTTEGETGEETSPDGDGQQDDEESQVKAAAEEESPNVEVAAVEQDRAESAAKEETEAEPAQTDDGTLQVETEGTESMAIEKEQTDMDENTNQGGSYEGSVPPAPHLPSPERSHTSIEGQMSTSALNIVWSFGLNRNVPVLNLSDGVRQAIMYPCAHVGIMYDFKNNKQHSLQAHLNPITCSAVSQDKRWLVTGDVGKDAMVNIWDTYTGTPIQTMFDPNPQGGVVAVALTPDSRYLATLSALPVQTLAIWDWTVDGDVPICSADLKPEYGLQNFIYFDSTDIHHVVTNSETQVLFYHWEGGIMEYYAPPLSDSDFNKPVGRYSQSLFQIGLARALTATSIGNLVVWDNNRPLSKIMDVNQSADKKPLKIIKVHDKGINVLTNTDEYIVIGDTAGHVKFFDQGLRLIYWYQDFHTGPCTAISFAYMPDFAPVPKEKSKYPSDATKKARPFIVRDFIVGTAIAVYCSIQTDGSKLKIIHREHDAAVHALDAHPRLPLIAIGSYSGLLKLWNYRTKEVVASRTFEKVHIQSCAFDPKGFMIVVGCTNGTVFIVDAVALLDQLQSPYKYARDAITHIAFAHNSSYFATADAGFTITVYKRQRKEGRNPYVWHGRYRSHYKPIRDLLFDVHLDSGEPKLLSLGEDRMLIEYDLHHVGKTHNHVVPFAEDRIEQGAIPQCMTKYPPISKEHFFLTANDQYKLKCYNSTTKMCRKTVLGPTYGSPIRKMMVVPTEKDKDANRFLAYITDDKVGLHFLPATGNPHLAMALIAHPSGISNLASSFDGAYLFTAGGPDFAVHMWEINIAALDAQAKLGGEDLVPFYGLLEGGRDGELFAELEDLFYYAQLRHQGINSMESREIGNRVPLTEVPYIMRAMGFYPSEQEIEDMINEIKYDEYVNLGHYQEDIDLGRFIRLYVNHRPAFGLSPEKLLWAFHTLAGSPELGRDGYIERGDLLEILQKKGEHMTEYELAEHLTTLLGFNKEGGSCEQELFEADKAGDFIAESLPFDINAEVLVNEILGFAMTVDPPGPDESKDVIKSGAS